jgi:hypothetical protein
MDEKICSCCGNRYESGGECDCDRNIQRIAELEAEGAKSARKSSAMLETLDDIARLVGSDVADKDGEDLLFRVRKLLRERDEAQRELSDCISACQNALGQLEKIEDALERADPTFLEGDETLNCVKLALTALAVLQRERQEQIDIITGAEIQCRNGKIHPPDLGKGDCLYCALAEERARLDFLQSCDPDVYEDLRAAIDAARKEQP